ncbi:PilN domain-containing protein [Vibrio ostreicida]|uniref:PilN domain-containing protein n=1 Tax=Vibrio ostreicida TaxID=526588 RepID=A0ABT8BQM8_9VIBR|nr:PilN domain-containing protein [Vibrio ostreicida]MDN3608410.1 PilN domain-containing protein [Vibrio ostreicida]NPD10232.1 hypothetical protein [Vibrio ostreicida]
MQFNINLCPWRESQRKTKTRRLAVMHVAAVGIFALCVWIVDGHLENQLNLQQFRLSQLSNLKEHLEKRQRALQELHSTLTEVRLDLEDIHGLNRQRYNAFRLLNLLPKEIPDGVYLDKVTLTNNRVSVAGFSSDTGSISKLLESLNKTSDVDSVTIQSIRHRQLRFQSLYQTFALSFSLVDLKHASL